MLYLIVTMLTVLAAILYIIRYRQSWRKRSVVQYGIMCVVLLAVSFLMIQSPFVSLWNRVFSVSMNSALWFANLCAMLSCFYGVKAFQLAYGARTTPWLDRSLLLSGILTTVALWLAGPHVTILATLPLTAPGRFPLFIDRVIYCLFLATMTLILTRLWWQQLQRTRYLVTRLSLLWLLLANAIALPYLLSAFLLSLTDHPVWRFLDVWLKVCAIACYALGTLWPPLIHRTIRSDTVLEHLRLFVVAVRLRPLWRDMTRRRQDVIYTHISLRASWRDTDKLRVAIRRSIIETSNAGQVIKDTLLHDLTPPAHIVQRRSLQEAARLDASCYQVFALHHEQHAIALLRQYPYYDHPNLTEMMPYFELVAHYYTLAQVIRYPLWALLEWGVGPHAFSPALIPSLLEAVS
jgi:uncharacterized MnhB-related membrane protein